MPENSIHISLIQTNLAWENPEKNLENIQSLLPNKNDSDWVVLPETFATGFSLKPESANHADQTIALMANLAGEKNYVISGSILVTANSGKLENRFYFFFPNGEINWYAKRHAFSLAGEHRIVQGGKERVLIKIKGWKIAPQVCYDLRFPVWSRYSDDYNYDLLVYTANWPAVRAQAWNQLLKARAIENQCYVLGVNRIGEDGNGIPHCGDTQAIGFDGSIIAATSPNSESCLHVTLNPESLLTFRKQFPFLEDADDFKLTL